MNSVLRGIVARALLAPAVLVSPLAAQDLVPTAWGRAAEGNGALDAQRVAWLGAWSPLRPVSDRARGLLRAPHAVGLFDAPPPVLGGSTLVGNPGAIVYDFDAGRAPARYSELIVRRATESGAFRRPLDASDPAVGQVSGQGWAPVGRSGVAMGRFVLDRESLGTSSFTARVYPYASSPFVMTDSVRPPTQRTRARLEGALSLRVLGTGVGLAAGVESREHNTIDFPLRRSGRNAFPAATVGVDRGLPWANLRLGAYYRWQEPNETNVLNPRPLPTVIYQLQGYDEPFAIPVQGSSANIFTRNEQRATARGATAEATLWGTRVVLAHERGARADDQTLAPFSTTRAIERWRARGNETSMQAGRALGGSWRALLLARQATQDGEGRRSDLTGVAFAGTDVEQVVEADLRWTPQGRWQAGARGGVLRTTARFDDFAALAMSDITSAASFVSVEAARRWSRVAVAVGGSYASRVALDGVLPPAGERAETYQRVLAPAIAYEVADLQAFAWFGTLTSTLGGQEWSLSLRTERAAPRSTAASRLQPNGQRRGMSIALGMR